MIKVFLTNNQGFKWYEDNQIYVKGFAFYNNEYFSKNEFISLISEREQLGQLEALVPFLNGSFSIVMFDPYVGVI